MTSSASPASMGRSQKRVSEAAPEGRESFGEPARSRTVVGMSRSRTGGVTTEPAGTLERIQDQERNVEHLRIQAVAMPRELVPRRDCSPWSEVIHHDRVPSKRRARSSSASIRPDGTGPCTQWPASYWSRVNSDLIGREIGEVRHLESRGS